jgi:antitoxin (DNA-binding transcriptional repressor) of toxin-antitoxin stability system
MIELSIREARAALSRLDEMMDKVGEIVITKRGRAIARMLPVSEKRPIPTHADLRASMRRLSQTSEQLIRSERDER